jgi:hypothetical protein
MGANRKRGPMCSISNPIDIDKGTMCLSVSPVPGPTCLYKDGGHMYDHNFPGGPQKASAIGLGVLSEVALGDFHEGKSTWTGTIINIGMGLIPIMGQIADARDTAAAAIKVWEKPSSALAWAGLGMAIVGWIPLVGDAAKGTTKVGRKVTAKVEQNAEKVIAKTAAPGLGEQMIKEEKRSGLNVDVAAQEHRHKGEHRKGSGKDVQSAHLVNSSSVSDVPGYIREKAVTVLLPAKQHKAFDDYWKAWAQKKSKARPGEEVKVTVAEWEKVLNSALDSVPELQRHTAYTMSVMIRTELYQTLGLKPDQLIRVPWSPRRTRRAPGGH